MNFNFFISVTFTILNNYCNMVLASTYHSRLDSPPKQVICIISISFELTLDYLLLCFTKLEHFWLESPCIARIFTGRQFHNRGPAEAKEQCCEVDILDRVTWRSLWSKVGNQKLQKGEKGQKGRTISLQR